MTSVLHRFEGLQQNLLRLVADHERLCAGAEPAREAIGAVRWRMAHCGRQRVRLMLDEVLPAAEAMATATRERRFLAEYRDGLPTYGQWIAGHIARWTAAVIIEDWTAYRHAAAEFRRHVRLRVEEEQALFGPLLTRTAASDAAGVRNGLRTSVG